MIKKISKSEIIKLAKRIQLRLSESEITEIYDEFQNFFKEYENFKKINVNNYEPIHNLTNPKKIEEINFNTEIDYDLKNIINNFPQVKEKYLKLNNEKK